MLKETVNFTTKDRRGRSFIAVMKEINTELAQIHKRLEKIIDKSAYKGATLFVDQYVSYTSVWNLKFKYNFENPEVALLQCLHLEYILEHEKDNSFDQERKTLKEMNELFQQYKPYTEEQIKARKEKMIKFIQIQNLH